MILIQITVHLFRAKYDAFIQNCQTKVYRGFSPVYGTLHENQLLRAQQNHEGDTDLPFAVTVYLFLAKKYVVFYFDLVFHDVRVF